MLNKRLLNIGRSFIKSKRLISKKEFEALYPKLEWEKIKSNKININAAPYMRFTKAVNETGEKLVSDISKIYPDKEASKT